MNNPLSIRKIFDLVRYDFVSNFNQWFYLLALQAGIMFVVSASLLWTAHFFSEESLLFSALEIFAAAIALLLPVLLVQNALDLAFDSAMRGLVFKGPFLYYFAARIVQSFILACVMMPFIFVAMAMLFDMQTIQFIVVNFFSLSFEVIAPFVQELGQSFIALPVVIVGVLCAFYVWLRLQFVSLEILEYRSSFVAAFKSSYRITREHTLLLVSILSLQFVLAFIGKVFLINLMAAPLEAVFHEMSLDLFSDAITFILDGFLIVGLSLISAHTYRYLVCPPSDNVTCTSCESCE